MELIINEKPLVEEWRDIEGYEGLYQISNMGNVLSLNYANRGYSQQLRQAYDKDGYKLVALHKDGQRKTFKVHRLVGKAFVPNPDGKPQINHLDEVRDHNWSTNLEWATVLENARYGNHCDKIRKSMEKRSGRSIVMLKNGQYIDTYISAAAAARSINGDSSIIIKICKGKKKSYYGYTFMYLEDYLALK